MTRYSKLNIIYRLQKWLDSVPGQTFLNYAYSWGASIVILGTLFKLTHLPGANLMLYIGMGTEVVVFFISAFDRPFDKTADGMDLATTTEIENELFGEEGEGEAADGETNGEDTLEPETATQQGYGPGGTIIIGGGGQAVAGTASEGMAAAFTGECIAADGQPLQGVAVQGSPAWLQQQQEVSPEMAEATEGYVEELKKLTEMLSKVSDQSERLTRDSEEMENLNRTLTGICKIYEMQLKGASQQVGTIDQINEQTRKMAGQIEQLNRIYARMIEAMTVNMRAAAPGAAITTNEE